MSAVSPGKGIAVAEEATASGTAFSGGAATLLTKAAAWVSERNVGFVVTSIGMIFMLLWAGAFKMTASGAEGIAPLVTHSPLMSWLFRLFGPYVGGDIIGATEWTAALLYVAGYRWPQAGIVGGIITVGMFFTTSTMLITTPGTTIVVHGIHYMNLLGLFLYKDVIAFGASFYLIGSYGKRAMAAR